MMKEKAMKHNHDKKNHKIEKKTKEKREEE